MASLVDLILARRARLLPGWFTKRVLDRLKSIEGYNSYKGYSVDILPHADALDFFFALGAKSDQVKTIVDAGANVGMMTRGFHLCFPQARIFAFEPNREVFKELQSNLRNREPFASAFERGQIELVNCGLFSSAAEMDLHVLASADSSSLIPLTEERRAIHPSLYKPVRIDKVSLITLDSFVREREIEHIDLLKIDVEGVYVDVLKGGREALSRTDRVLVEIDWSVKGPRSRDWIDAADILYDSGLYLRAIVDIDGNRRNGFSIRDALDLYCHCIIPPPMKSYVMNCIFERM